MAAAIDPETVHKVVELVRNGRSARSAARELGICHTTVLKYCEDESLVADDAEVPSAPVASDSCPEPRLPDPFPQFYKPFLINDVGHWGVLCDPHLPYHDKRTLELFIDECKRRGVRGVLFNGDVLDSHELSDHDKDPSAPRYVEEIEVAKQFFAWARASLPGARFVYKAGNHEERLDRYIVRKAPALFGLKNVTLSSLIGLSDYGVEWVSGKRVIELGKLNVVHGHEFGPGGVSSPVNPARGLYLKAKSVALVGHHHRTSEHHDKDIRLKSEAAWSVGCACFLHPFWRPLNNWNLGFAFVEVFKGRKFHVENKRVLNGEVM